MAADYPWQNPNFPQAQGFSLPVSIGPMALTAQKPRPRWRGAVAWSLCLFAGGVAAGPTLTDYAYEGIEAGAGILAKRAPRLLGRYRPAETAANSGIGAPSSASYSDGQKREAIRGASVEPLPSAPAVADADPRTRSKHARVATKGAPPSLGEPAVAAAPAARKSKSRDPFEAAGEGDSSGKREAKAAPEPPVAKSEPVAKPVLAKNDPPPKSAKSSDGLDNLMADVVTEGSAGAAGKPKTKKSTSKDIDAMLKDVQKSEPAPPPKRVEKADLPQLTSSDIAKAMGTVKTRANACGKSTGQKGVAELKLNVGKDGKVSDVTVGGKMAGTPAADCIEKAARAASFPPNAGLKFDYRIDVH